MLERPKDDLAVRLMKAMNKKGMTTKALGVEIGNHNLIWRVQNGQMKCITTVSLVKLCNTLEVSADYLLGLKEEMK